MSPAIGTNFCLGSFEKFQPGVRETKQTWRNTKIITFAPIIASATLKAVSLQLNEMLMMWKIQQAMPGKQSQTLPSGPLEFIPLLSRLPGWSVHMAKFPARLRRSRMEKSRSWEPSQAAHSYEHIENFTKDLQLRRNLGNRGVVRSSGLMWAIPTDSNEAHLPTPGSQTKLKFTPSVHTYQFLFENQLHFSSLTYRPHVSRENGHRNRFTEWRVLKTAAFRYVWMDGNGGFRIRWSYTSFTSSMAHA